jgi:molybdenum cofactor guanylyltransferase
MDKLHKIGVVLAGGASRRMGVDKLSLPVSPENGMTILEHVVNCANCVADDLYIAHAPTPSFSLESFPSSVSSQIHFVQDETWYDGPLGVLSRLYSSLPKADMVYIVAGDLPGLHPHVLEACGNALMRVSQAQGMRNTGDKTLEDKPSADERGTDAALVQRDGTLQPLLGCYRLPALSVFSDAWQAGETRLMPVMKKLKIEPVVSEEAKWPSWWTKPVHTPEEYATWKREWRGYHAT